jgi:hypothetical protein
MKLTPFFDTPEVKTLSISIFSARGSCQTDPENGDMWNLCILQSIDRIRSSSPSRTVMRFVCVSLENCSWVINIQEWAHISISYMPWDQVSVKYY